MAKETIEAPMPGRVRKVSVAVGDNVDEGAVICTLEAMKMENPILSPIKGSVTELGVSPDQHVDPGNMIAVIEG